VDPSIPDSSEAAFDEIEAHRRRAVRNMMVALVITPVNLTILAKTVDHAPNLALASLTIVTSIQLVTGLRAWRAGEAALKARTADMSRPKGAHVAIIIGFCAVVTAILLWAFGLLSLAMVLLFKPPHY